MPAAVARSMLDVAEFVAVTVWPVAARQQRRVAILASRVPVPNHPNDGNAHCPRQKRICRWLGEFVDRQAGSGLGTQFLRHIERTRLLVHLADVSDASGRADVVKDVEVILGELASFGAHLEEKPMIMVASKIDA